MDLDADFVDPTWGPDPGRRRGGSHGRSRSLRSSSNSPSPEKSSPPSRESPRSFVTRTFVRMEIMEESDDELVDHEPLADDDNDLAASTDWRQFHIVLPLLTDD